MMPKFRKKPVVIEAVQWTGKNVKEIMDFMSWRNAAHDDRAGLTIHTLEGNHHASPGDWIIKGVKGEFYPCKPDIFAATYEPEDKGGAPQMVSEVKADPRASTPWSSVKFARVNSVKAEGMRAAAKLIEKRRDDYITEHGSLEWDTGTMNFPGNGTEMVGEWEELIELIEAEASRIERM